MGQERGGSPGLERKRVLFELHACKRWLCWNVRVAKNESITKGPKGMVSLSWRGCTMEESNSRDRGTACAGRGGRSSLACPPLLWVAVQPPQRRPIVVPNLRCVFLLGSSPIHSVFSLSGLPKLFGHVAWNARAAP